MAVVKSYRFMPSINNSYFRVYNNYRGSQKVRFHKVSAGSIVSEQISYL